ncbi:hypothetical protein EV2_020848 [Malus domestica]
MLLQNALVQKPAESNDNLGPRKKSLCDIGNLLTLQNLALKTVDAEDKKEPEDALQAEENSTLSASSLHIDNYIFVCVLSISLSALGSLKWLQNNKPKTQVLIIYMCRNCSNHPSIIRSAP